MPRTTPPLTIKELLDKEEWLAMYPLIRQLNPDMCREQFELRLTSMLAQGYRCIGAYRGESMVGLAGFWIGTRLWCGQYIDIDNVVVDESERSSGVGKQMVAWVENAGKQLGCEIAVLDSYVVSHAAHRFYFREGYIIRGYHFTKAL